LGVRRVLHKETLVSVTLHVGVEGHPRLATDEVLAQPFEPGWVLDAVLRLAEHHPEQVIGAAEVVEDGDVVGLECLALEVEQRWPVIARWYDPIEAELALLVSHLQE